MADKVVIRQAVIQDVPRLATEHTNPRAWKFWERRGFEMDQEFRHYFRKA